MYQSALSARGPLSKVTVVELAGLGPGPFCAMLLADFGASVVRIARPGHDTVDPVLGRGRKTIVLDLKSPEDRDAALRVISDSTVLIEGFRPGVMERLGLGPRECHGANGSLVYARLTGWGQSGELSHKAGHDINYIAMSGVLASIGGEKPIVPLNLIGDYAGGALLASFGILAALRAVEAGDRNVVIDSSMRSGSAYLLSYQFQQLALGLWRDQRCSNLLDGAAPFYDTYRCSDGQWLAVGAIEERFYNQLLIGLELESLLAVDRFDPANHDRIRGEFTAKFEELTREQWLAAFRDLDACVSPVLSMTEVAADSSIVRERISGMPEPRPTPVIWSQSPSASDIRGIVDTEDTPTPAVNGTARYHYP
jgi:alpha-methylacyl-CoA racemase